MWQVSWPKSLLIAVALTSISTWSTVVHAQDYIVQQNQNGFDLPGVNLPQGQDEVRAADGTTCASSVAGSGAYLDVGVIRGNRSATGNDVATYGRVVVPIGRKPQRLDCAKLYELEVERLRMELDLLKMGVSSDAGMTAAIPAASEEPAAAPAAPAKLTKLKRKPSKNWASEGWSNGDGK